MDFWDLTVTILGRNYFERLGTSSIIISIILFVIDVTRFSENAQFLAIAGVFLAVGLGIRGLCYLFYLLTEGPSRVKRRRRARAPDMNEMFDKAFGHTKGQNINASVTLTPQEAEAGCTRVLDIASDKPCETCQGSGLVANQPCPICGGQKRLTTTKQVQVSIPSGTKNGTRLRIAGMGQRGVGGTNNGDLYITVVTA